MKNNSSALKRVLSVVLCAVMLFSSVAVGLVPGINLIVLAKDADVYGNISISVPDTIYLEAAEGKMTEFQYYYNSDSGSAVAGYEEKGKVFFINNDTDNLTVSNITANLTDAGGNYILKDMTVDADNTDTEFDGSLPVDGGLTAGNYELLTWEFTYDVETSDKVKKTYHSNAYTVAYAPDTTVNAAQVAQLLKATAYADREILNMTFWMTGATSVSALDDGYTKNDVYTDAKYKWNPLTQANPSASELAKGADSDGLKKGDTLDGCYISGNGAIGYHGYFWDENGDGGSRNFVDKYVSKFVYDSSRISNMNQLPNFKMGLDIHENWGGWNRITQNESNAAGFTCWSLGYNKSIDGADHTNILPEQKSEGANSSRAKGRVATNTIIPNISLSDITGSTNGRMYSFQRARNNGNEVNTNVYMYYTLVPVNKGALREKMYDAAQYSKELYSADSWNALQGQLKIAALTLGNPAAEYPAGASDFSALITAIDTKIDELETKVTLHSDADDAVFSNGTDTYETYVVIGGDGSVKLSSDVVPTRPGYTFKGWSHTQKSSSAENNVSVKHNDNLYAVWTPTQYQAKIKNTVGGTATPTYSVENPINLDYTASTKAYYEHKGDWIVTNTVGNFVKGEIFSGTISGKYGEEGVSVEIEPVYVPLEYNVSFNSMGGSAVETQTYTYETLLSLASISANTGYDLIGWQPEESVGNWEKGKTYTAIIAMHGDKAGDTVKLDAVWTAKSAKITFNLAEGETTETGVTELNYQFSDKAGARFELPKAVKVGYDFTGWKISKTYYGAGDTTDENNRWEINKEYTLVDGKVTLEHNKVGDVELTPMFTPIVYPIQYRLDYDVASEGGTQEQIGDSSYTIESEITLPAAPARIGYNFVGWDASGNTDGNWCVDRDGDGIIDTVYAAGEKVKGKYGKNKDTATVLVAKWEPTEYEVYLDVNGGDALSTDMLIYTTDKTLDLTSLNPQRTAYDFAGWKVTNIIAYTETDEVAVSRQWKIGDIYNYKNSKCELPSNRYGSMLLTAQWTPKTYELVRPYSTSSEQVTYNTEDTFTLGTARKGGYAFESWQVNTAEAGSNWEKGVDYLATQKVTGKYGKVEFTPQFTANTYTMKFVDSKNSQLETIAYTIEDEVEIPAAHSENGYDTLGWKVKSFDTDSGGWYVGMTIAARSTLAGNKYFGDVVIEPDLSPITYTITMVTPETMAKTEAYYNILNDYTYNPNYRLPVLSSKPGYDFEGWLVEETSGNWPKEGTVIEGDTLVTGYYGDVTLSEKWKPKEFTVIYKDDTVILDTEVVKYNEYASGLTEEKRSKAPDAQYVYTFNHWEPSLGRIYGNTTYQAVYTKELRTYEVKWMVPAVSGETLGNYSEDSSNLVQYGKTPVYNNGIDPKIDSGTADYVWRFSGWGTTDDVNETPMNVLPAVTGNITYYAKFEKIVNPVNVTWILDAENGIQDITPFAVGEIPKRATEPVKAESNGMGYTFYGWSYTDAFGKTVVSPKSTSLPAVEQGGSYTYTAVYVESALSFEYTLDLAGGSIGTAVTGKYKMGEMLKLPVPTRNGYTFTGWQASLVDPSSGTWTEGSTLDKDGEIVYAWGNVIFTAMWEPQTYKITYVASTADDYIPEDQATQFYDITSTDTLKSVATRSGYTLSGWVVAASSGSWTLNDVFGVDYALAGNYGDVTLKPVWSLNSYTITWDSGDGLTTQTSFKYGSAVVAQSPVPKNGYSAYWIDEIPETMPAENITITAEYIPIEYYVRLYTKGGTEVENFTYKISDLSELPETERDGADFIGWQVISSDGSWKVDEVIPAGTPLTGNYGNITLVAQWKLHEFKITWEAGDVTKTVVWQYGAMPSYGATPYKSDDESYSYEFEYWMPEIEPVTSDTTYTAIFKRTERKYTVKWLVLDDSNPGTYSETYYYGETPTYKYGTPSMDDGGDYTYTFTGWSPTVNPVTDSCIYVAQFSSAMKLQSLYFTEKSYILTIGDKCTTEIEIRPVGASVSNVVFRSFDESVAKINSLGEITAVGEGYTVVSASSADGKFVSYCVVIVNPIYSTRVNLTANNISTTQLPGSSIQLYATVEPSNATHKKIIWTSSNPAVASVDATGMVTFIKEGTATITAKAEDGFAYSMITVTTSYSSGQEEPPIIIGPDDLKPQYSVEFAGASTNYILLVSYNGESWESLPFNAMQFIVRDGEEIVFRMENTEYFPLVNGKSYQKPSADGYYHFYVHDNMSVIDEILPIGIDDIDVTGDDAVTFLQKLQAFFRSIVQFFRKLFGGG